ncbi:MAG: hypothetical protein NT066_05315 [Candidatus Omnitrophica bacterium]|nr:hypothetical protein [Candidatus Omnitrophota bacterium]
MSAEEAKTAEQPAKPQEAKPAVEKQTNCLSCNKPIRKLKRYYRDGKFYCSKKCWRNFLAKSKEGKK